MLGMLKFSSEELDEARLAVGVVAMFLESPLVEQLEAEGAGEVVRVELLAHGRHALAGDGFLTLGAEGAPLGVVVDLTVRLTVMVVIVATRKRHATHLQRREKEQQ